MKRSKRSQSNKRSKKKPDTDAKKKLLESIAAELHTLPGVKVERNKWLPSLRNPKHRREIDVLLTVKPLGYQMRLAIECKNLAKPVEAEDIGSFIDKLEQVGIPSQGSIYVSASGYRSGAVTRAQEAGIVLLTPAGLTKDRLSLVVEEAFQSVVFLLLAVDEYSWTDDVHQDVYSQLSEIETHTLYDNEGQICGVLPDLIWEEWHYEGNPSSIIGEHTINLPIPSGWHHVIRGKKEPIKSATAKVVVWGIVVSITGKVERVSLLDALTKNVEKFRLKASFDTSKREYPITTFTKEEDFEAFESQPRTFHVITERIRLPRILTHVGYWPQSRRVFMLIATKLQSFLRGEIPDPRPFDYKDLEGTNLATVWEPPFAASPAVKRNVDRKPFGL